MYYYISGTLVHAASGMAVIDNNGIGYKMTVSDKTIGKLMNTEGNVKLYTYLVTREDSSELYGFYDTEECHTFQMLITVSGVGPKAAMSILSELTPTRFAMAVISNDPKAISAAQGIGLKTAQKIILELHDKMKKNQTAVAVKSPIIAGDSMTGSSDDVTAAADALVVLGYTRKEAYDALDGIADDTPLEEMIRRGLKKLMR
ncbi:MAG: Holliday junction branch migration protein RuvA [Ruminococcaceae bacterium]|nr:Holliday junction branch migration protein RuvA [Oscillospiraceae bacterium]